MTQWEALALTLALEVPVALAIAWFAGLRDKMWRTAAVSVAASLITHPFAWYLAIHTQNMWPFWPRAALIETGVTLIEAVVYAKGLPTRWTLATVMSVAANGFSFFVGLALL